MKAFITGVNGFLGAQLANHWSNVGWQVGGSMRSGSDIRQGLAERIEIRHYELDGPVPPYLFHDVEFVVHCAHDITRGTRRENIEGTKALYEQAVRDGVLHQLFVSSYSARPDTPIEYGQVKYEIECFMRERGAAIIRPGLVVGNGGLFGRNLDTILGTRVIPLLDGGKDLLPLLALSDFLKAMTVVVSSKRSQDYNLFGSELTEMRRLVERVAQIARRRILFVNVPTALASFLILNLDRLGIPLPIDIDRIRALKLNQQPIYASDLATLIDRETSLDNMLIEALAARKLTYLESSS